MVIEFETLPPMTENPSWAIEITRILADAMAAANAKHGLKSVLRITPNDTREMERPPRMRSGPLYEAMVETFEGCARAGAELLSIESVGGKEVHDEALMMGDLRGVIFGLCVLGVRDMRFLWTELDRIARKHGVRCAGDTACGFGNTAMVLAEQRRWCVGRMLGTDCRGSATDQAAAGQVYASLQKANRLQELER